MLSRRRILLIGGIAAVGAGAYTLSAVFPSAAGSALAMTAPEAHAAAANQDILIIDIRRPDEWSKTGIPEHAVPIDMRTDDFVARLIAARLSDTQPVAVICARGVRSARVTRLLEDAGVGPIIDIPEGMLGSSAGPGWLDRGLPVVTF